MSELRSAILQSGQELAVETNQRALIDKVLARYSGQFTLYRELLQNADDAGASQVQITFKSAEQHPLHHPTTCPPLVGENALKMSKVEFRNDGQPFSEQDWARLRKIAEGNPDESKIGAFGVGYFSTFAVAEEPLVSSGDTAMLFFWRGDALFVRQGHNTNVDTDKTEDGKPWTTFDLTFRQPDVMPEPEHFARFLTDALVFTSRLRSIHLLLDEHILCSIHKTIAPTQSLIPARNINLRSSPIKMLQFKSIDFAPVQLTVDAMKWITQPETTRLEQVAAEAEAHSKRNILTGGASRIFSAFGFGSKPTTKAEASKSIQQNEIDLRERTQSTVFLRVVNGSISVSCPRQLSTELERATKKKPPSQTTFSMLYNSHDEHLASMGDGGRSPPEAHRLFAKLLTDLSKQGSVAIGFMTHQTTGYASSIGARFIPTVERESLDLMNAHTADWNKELLWMGGTLARIVYEDQMAEIKKLWTPSLDAELRQRLLARFVHLAKFFTFSQSTPSPLVSSNFQAAFFAAAAPDQLSILSSEGPMPLSKVRQPDHTLLTFLKSTPVLAEEVVTQAQGFMMALQDRRLLKEIDLNDILAELSSRALEPEELQAALNWWISLANSPGYAPQMRGRFLDTAMFSTQIEGQSERVTSLSAIKYYLGPRSLLSKVSPPPEALPMTIARPFKQTDLHRIFGWLEMPATAELTYLLSPALTGPAAPERTNMLKDAEFAEEVLATCSRNWGNLNAAAQSEVAKIIADAACIPSTDGLKRPADTYFDNIDSLHLDLAVVRFPGKTTTRGNMEKMLLAAGVKRHVDLQIIFTKLVAGGSWSHVDLVKYLISVQDSLTSSEFSRLSKTAWLPKEGESATNEGGQSPKYRASELYEPSQVLRVLKFPLLSWTGRFADAESKFLGKLGLHKHPSARAVLQAAADPKDATRRKDALQYYLEHYSSRYSGDQTQSDLAYIPAINSDGSANLCKSHEVFGNSMSAVLGFKTLPSSYSADASKLRVAHDPPSEALVNALLTETPQDRGKATAIYSYLSTKIVMLSDTQLGRLSKLPIIPVVDKKTEKLSMKTPNSCYFSTSSSPAIAAVFTSIDFGLPSKPFLAACGVRDTPSTSEIAEMLVNDAPGILRLAGSSEAYLDVLRPIAASRQELSQTLNRKLRTSAFFLTTTKVAHTQSKKGTDNMSDADDQDEDSFKVVTKLTAPVETIIGDDVNATRLFATHINAAPEEDLLETFAESLGASRISLIVKNSHSVSRASTNPTPASEELRDLLLERTFLFLHERQRASDRDVVRGSDWLNKHFRCIEVLKLDIHRSLSFAGQTKRIVQPASATAELTRGNDLILYFTSTGIEDWYEVASSLCRFIFNKQRVTDALLLTSLLSTPLRVLQRRGYDTSRVLNSRKAAHQKKLEQQREEGLKAELSKPAGPTADQLDQWTAQLLAEFPDANPDLVKRLLQAQSSNHYDSVHAQLEKGYKKATQSPMPEITTDRQTKASESLSSNGDARSTLSTANSESRLQRPNSSREKSSLLNGFRKKFLGDNASGSSYSSSGGNIPSIGQQAVTPGTSAMPRPTSKTTGTSTQPGETATPYSNISANVQQAISAARPDQRDTVQSQESKRYVHESENGYCDSNPGQNLVFVSLVDGLRFYADRTVDAERALIEHRESLSRFITLILKPLSFVFGMRIDAFHLFFDLRGPAIAFNSAGAIWFNLRFYLSWHDEQVRQGVLEPALLSNYFSLAHELAHNLVSTHDAQHGFYTCAIAELHFSKMAALLDQTRNRQYQQEQPLVSL